ncbi:putative ribonuclease H-like domain-containing protein, partial [Tanacetum coccineum]
IYVDDIIFGSTKKELSTEFEKLMHDKFQMSSIGELTFFLGLQVQQKSDGIFIIQDEYVAEILKKISFATVKTASTPMEPNKALIKDEEAEEVDVHLYRSMIGSLMYLIASRPDITFVVCACARFQVTLKTSHLYDVKRIFRYLKGQPKLGLWYSRDSPFYLEAFSDSDYAGARLDKKSTTGGCQFLGKSLISWQCKKQTIVANSTNEAEYVAAANCYGHNPVSHSKTKHIEIRHHFIRDSYEKKLIQVIKIHTDQNVADLLTKAFDVSRLSILSAWVGDEAVHKKLGDRMEKAATTTFSLEAEQDSGSGPRCQDTILGDADTQTSNLEFYDMLTWVAYLQKSKGSEGFHQIIDFLNASHIQYAFTENPTIYVSFIKQFWKTATARTSANGKVEITATIDGQVKTITEASLRRHLKLEDNGGVNTLPNSEISEQLALMGTPQAPNTQSIHDAEEAVSMPYESPLHSVHSLRRDEGSLSLSELKVLCTNFSNKVTSLEAEMAQTKQTYGTALTKLIKKVKKLEQTVKSTQSRRRFRIVVSDDEEDEGTSWIQEDIEIQEKVSDDTKVVLEEEEPTELVEDQGSVEK